MDSESVATELVGMVLVATASVDSVSVAKVSAVTE